MSLDYQLHVHHRHIQHSTTHGNKQRSVKAQMNKYTLINKHLHINTTDQ